MKTKVYKIDEKNIEKTTMHELGKRLRDGELVAFPTETVYGLGANGLDEEAIRKIFIAKGRPSDNPLILHIADIEALDKLCIIKDKRVYELTKTFWPGPLTLVLERREIVPNAITAGLETVAVRMPKNDIALSLIKSAKVPIAAPSANKSGSPSPTNALHVLADMDGRIENIIDGGSTGVGLESTVLDMTLETPTILRPGAITLEALEMVLGRVIYDQAVLDRNEIPRSPGQKYKHYSPKTNFILIRGKNEKIAEFINKSKEQGEAIGLMASSELCKCFKSYCYDLGPVIETEQIAHNLFNAMRELDKLNLDVIYCQALEEQGLGIAIMNRLKKASGGRIIDV